MKIVVALFVLLGAGAARAESPFDVLARPKASWTYQVYEGRRATGATLTMTVSEVHTLGAYTYVVIDAASEDEAARGTVPFGVMIIGPDGVRAVINLPDPEDGPIDDAVLKAKYEGAFLPTVYLPAQPTKKKWKEKLERFAEDDREYDLKGAVSSKGSEWRVTWTGHYTVPENGERDRISAETDFDPAVGFTQICAEKPLCLRLAK